GIRGTAAVISLPAHNYIDPHHYLSVLLLKLAGCQSVKTAISITLYPTTSPNVIAHITRNTSVVIVS
ncbi:MAG: hypothetical protein JSW05_07640, partial [Candidatus Thorarchaeota archaeon]